MQLVITRDMPALRIKCSAAVSISNESLHKSRPSSPEAPCSKHAAGMRALAAGIQELKRPPNSPASPLGKHKATEEFLKEDPGPSSNSYPGRSSLDADDGRYSRPHKRSSATPDLGFKSQTLPEDQINAILGGYAMHVAPLSGGTLTPEGLGSLLDAASLQSGSNRDFMSISGVAELRMRGTSKKERKK
eukprot:gene5733-6022_t